MGCDSSLNNSIREKLLKRCDEFGYLGQEEVRGFRWGSWDNAIEARRGLALDLFNKWIHSCPFTPAEFRYIHENLSERAWDKLGLKLPEKPKLEYEIVQLVITQREGLKEYIGRLEKDLFTHTCGCLPCDCSTCISIFGSEADGCSIDIEERGRDIAQQRLAAFRAVLAAQKPKFLIPDDLPDEVVEGWMWWMDSDGSGCPATQSSECPNDQPECDKYCGSLFPGSSERFSVNTPYGIRDCPCHRHSTKAVYAHMKEVLAAQKPKQKKEEFVPYAAVFVGINPERWAPHRGSIIHIIDKGKTLCGSPVGFDSFSRALDQSDIVPITNPHDMLKIAQELTGEKGMVERIKEHVDEHAQTLYERGGVDSVTYRVCDVILDFINKEVAHAKASQKG